MKKDLFIIFFSILIAIVLAKTGALRVFLEEMRDFEILASFASGFFFTSIFTISPAIVAPLMFVFNALGILTIGLVAQSL